MKSGIGIPGRHFLARSEEMTYLLPFSNNHVHGKDDHKQGEADTNNAKGVPHNIHIESLSFQPDDRFYTQLPPPRIIYTSSASLSHIIAGDSKANRAVTA